jgi:hypothetical protein
VEIEVYWQKMTGKVLKYTADSITVTIPITDQSGDVRRFSVTGTALFSIDGAAARVPVSVQSTGEYVRMQVIGAAEILQRRMHVRVPVSAQTRLVWQSHPEGPFAWAESTAVDISVGGVRIASTKTVWPSIGTEVQVSVQLPGGEITEQAAVIGKTPTYDLRLEFVSLSVSSRAIIEALTKKRDG